MTLIRRCICGAAEFVRYESPNGLTCAVCFCGTAHLVTEQRPEEIAAMYAGEYHGPTTAGCIRPEGAQRYADRFDHDYRLALDRIALYLAIAGRRQPFRSALDVGCANGAFVRAIANTGTEHAVGVDPDPQGEHERCVRGGVRDIAGSFELVTYHDVLEHVIDPVAELRAAAMRVALGGVLVVDVPDVWTPAGHHHYRPEHLWYFRLEALSHAIEKAAGLRVFAHHRPIPGKLVIYAGLEG